MTSKRTSSASHQNSIMRMMSNRPQASPSSSDEENAYLSIARSHSLVDDMEDSPMQPSSSPQKKRRVSPQLQSSGGWQGFCKKGTRFKAMLDDAFVKVVSSSSDSGDEEGTSSTESRNPVDASNAATSISPSAQPSTVANLARQKTAECILLQQELEKVKAEQTV